MDPAEYTFEPLLHPLDPLADLMSSAFCRMHDGDPTETWHLMMVRWEEVDREFGPLPESAEPADTGVPGATADPALSGGGIEELERLEYTLHRFVTEFGRTTDAERRLTICALIRNSVAGKPRLFRLPGIKALLREIYQLEASLQTTLIPTSEPAPSLPDLQPPTAATVADPQSPPPVSADEADPQPQPPAPADEADPQPPVSADEADPQPPAPPTRRTPSRQLPPTRRTPAVPVEADAQGVCTGQSSWNPPLTPSDSDQLTGSPDPDRPTGPPEQPTRPPNPDQRPSTSDPRLALGGPALRRRQRFWPSVGGQRPRPQLVSGLPSSLGIGSWVSLVPVPGIPRDSVPWLPQVLASVPVFVPFPVTVSVPVTVPVPVFLPVPVSTPSKFAATTDPSVVPPSPSASRPARSTPVPFPMRPLLGSLMHPLEPPKSLLSVVDPCVVFSPLVPRSLLVSALVLDFLVPTVSAFSLSGLLSYPFSPPASSSLSLVPPSPSPSSPFPISSSLLL
ncbi:vegetative cell wall protein gp1-like [Etheostoma spectabile]|uniref:vegetative cell wall protein gp1-like n=1 Tax=Etheostoma spectabile TaxID=54343 RepID=UPI0013AF97F0|nr:vegetative cell wall protein gp1-like [Etheostoma spectabile]